MSTPKVILITGTSSDLGLATAVLFAEKGYKVYATMRNLRKKDDLLKAAEEPPIRMRTSKWANEFCHLKTVGDPDGTKLVEEVYNAMIGDN